MEKVGDSEKEEVKERISEGSGDINKIVKADNNNDNGYG